MLVCAKNTYQKHYFFATLILCVLTLCGIMLGAYVRLTHAGLGCPDWPFCYGHFWMPLTEQDIFLANTNYTDSTFVSGLAAREMLHRYLVSMIGLVIIYMVYYSQRYYKYLTVGRSYSFFLLVAVCLQGAFGMWTVTLKLMPLIVTSHLLGGMLLWSFIVYHFAGQTNSLAWYGSYYLKIALWIFYVLLLTQIALGGWVSANYAALGCVDFPYCQGVWVPSLNLSQAFDLWHPLHYFSNGLPMTPDIYTTIHWCHRLGALIVTFYSIIIIAWLFSLQFYRSAILLSLVLTVQICLGILNVLCSVPLFIAVAHNGLAAIFLACVLILQRRLSSCVE